MEKRMLWLGLMLMVIGLCSSGALAQTMGPPAAGLDAGQFRVGVDISSSSTGIDLDGESTAQATWQEFTGPDLTESEVVIGDLNKFESREEIQSDMIFANLGYGILDKLEVFLLLGMSDLRFDDEDSTASSEELAYGFGVKGTIYEEGDVKFGALFQMTWASFEGDLHEDDVEVYREETAALPEFYEWFDDVPGDWELDYYQIKLAVGPTYKLTENISIYGGPFYQLMDGNLDTERSREYIEISGPFTDIYNVHEETSIDISARSKYGIYFGAQINCGENLPIRIECQTSNDTYVVGANLAYSF